MRDLMYGEFLLHGGGQFATRQFADQESADASLFVIEDRLKLQLQRMARRAGQEAKIATDDTAGLAAAVVGEVHNRRELLASSSRDPLHASDADLLLSLYQESGLRLSDRINGLFTAVIYDWRQDTLVLLQDRFSGQQSLFWAVCGDRLVFATDVSLLLNYHDLAREVDLHALKYFLVYSFVPADRTLFAGIRKLPSDHALLCRDGGVTVQEIRYPRTRLRGSTRDPDRLLADYLDLMRKSVARRVEDTEGEIGFALSAGFDTNLNALLASEVLEQPSHAFSVGTAEPEHEIGRTREIVRRFYPHIAYHEYMVTGREILELPRIIHLLGVPLAEPGIILAYCLSRMAQEHVDVILGGEAADQIFYVVPRAMWARRAQWWLRASVRRLSIFRPLIERRRESRAAVPAGAVSTTYFTESELSELLKTEHPRVATSEKHIYDTVLRYCLLKKTMHRFFGISARFPYLDADVRDFVGQLPYELRQNKILHRRALWSLIPADAHALFDKKPGATATPLQFEDRSLRSGLFAHLRASEVLAGHMHMSGVSELIEEYDMASGMELQVVANKLFSLLSFDVWYRLFIMGQAPEEIMLQLGSADKTASYMLA